MSETIVVVGASLAGGTATARLREEGFDGRLVLIGAEALPPYERPPLSKEHLRGEMTFEETLLRPQGWYEEHDIELRLGTRADRLDPRAREVVLEGGQRVAFERALIATGARNRRLAVPGADLEGVLDLRVASDSERIRTAAASGGRAVVVGMGFIGAEVTASLRRLGVEVTVVEFFETALYRVLGRELGSVLEAIHRDEGVRMHFREGVERFEGSSRVEAVISTSGRRIDCDFVVVGVGVQPNVEVVEGTEIVLDDGVVVGPALETNVPGIFAAGDVARHEHPLFGPIRVEHFDNAIKMGDVAARNLLGAGEVFDDPHWFWSDQYDVNIQMAGFAATWDEVVIRGSIEDRSFTAFFLAAGILRAALSINRPRDVRRAMPLIRAALRPDPPTLRNEDTDLRTLLPS